MDLLKIKTIADTIFIALIVIVLWVLFKRIQIRKKKKDFVRE